MKTMVRQAVLVQLKSLESEEKQARDKRLSQAFLMTRTYQESQTIAIFLSMPFEFDTSEIILKALANGKQVFVPKVFDKGEMQFFAYDPAYLTRSKFGVLEPSQGRPIPKEKLDLIIVPGLAWQQDGYRVGFGGGFYDRYLSDFRGQTVSLAYDFQRLNFEVDPHDIAVKEVIDESNF